MFENKMGLEIRFGGGVDKKASFEMDTKHTFSNGLTNDSSQKSELSSFYVIKQDRKQTFVNYNNNNCLFTNPNRKSEKEIKEVIPF